MLPKFSLRFTVTMQHSKHAPGYRLGTRISSFSDTLSIQTEPACIGLTSTTTPHQKHWPSNRVMESVRAARSGEMAEFNLEAGRVFVDLFVAAELKIAAYNVWDRLDQVKDGTLTIADLEQLSQKVRITGPNAANYWTADFWTNMLKHFDIDGDKTIDRQEFFWGLSRQLVDTELKRKGVFGSKNSVIGLIDEMRKFLNDALMSILKNIAYASCGKQQCSDFTVLESIFMSKIISTNEFGPVYEIEGKLKELESEPSIDIILKLDQIGGEMRQATDEAFDRLDGDNNGFLNPDDFGNSQVTQSLSFYLHSAYLTCIENALMLNRSSG